ncbi:ferritin [Paenirhodobacter sp.]|uniref:ferritin n=1 Tax=Paenirhodobacter sp. TaxID=1965326 RepID=UPI003B3E12CF
MTNKPLTAALNDLMNGELRAHHIYLQTAAWAAERNLDGCHKFLLHHAAEELEHMHRLFGFLNDLGAAVTFEALPAPKITANDVTGLFKVVAEQEASVTKAVHAVLEQARAANDHAVASFLNWFVDEQHEEDTLCRTVLDRIALIGDGPQALYFIDKEIGALAA